MNNKTWKILGGIGASLLLLRQLINLIYAIVEGQIEWWEPMDFLWTFITLVAFGLIAAGFFTAQTGGESNTVVSHTPAPQPVASNEPAGVPTVGTWLGWQLILMIPLVGFVFMIIWAIDKTNPVRRNWILANLILAGIFVVLYILLIVLILAANM